ncbi:MAG: leucine-rich repeat protein [Clostridia bacterium]|nr:leucine-rich repeat protein [Clostridia bacterium]
MIFSTTSALAVTDTVTKSGTFSYSNGSGSWTLYSDGELVISGTGYMWPSTSATVSSYPWYSYRSSIKKVTVEEGITFLGYQAFYGYNITSVSLPNGFIQIGKETFRNCDWLTSIKIPNTVTNIGEYAFYDCDRLTDVQVLGSMYTINSNAFGACDKLTEIVITASSVNSEAFNYCSSLKTVTITNTNLSVYQSAFANCTALTNVNFTGTATQWNNIKTKSSSYTGNDKLWNATLTYVNKLTFDVNGGDMGVASIFAEAGSTVTIPTDTPTRKGYTFQGWGTYKYDTFVTYNPGDTMTLSANTSLYAVWETPDGVIAKGTHPNTDMSWILYEDGRLVCSGTGSVYADSSLNNNGYMYYKKYIKDVIINEGITSIGSNAFYAVAVSSVTLPSTLTTIGGNAFAFSNIKTVTIPECLSTIGKGVFLGTPIESIHLGNPSYDISALFVNCMDMGSLKTITVDENNALYTVVDGVLFNKDMTNLIRVPVTMEGTYVIPDTIVTISSYAFSHAANLTGVVVPTSLKTVEQLAFDSTLENVYYKGTEEQWNEISIAYNTTGTPAAFQLATREYEYGKTYTIAYNANGGENAPANGEKVKGEDYTLPETIPEKAGYNFLGWAITADATVAQYQPGDIYTENAETVFYAVWELKEPTVDFTATSRMWMFHVSVSEHQDNLTAYVATYLSDGTILDCDCYPIENAMADLMLIKDANAAYARVFVLTDANMTPYTKSVTVPVN